MIVSTISTYKNIIGHVDSILRVILDTEEHSKSLAENFKT